MNRTLAIALVLLALVIAAGILAYSRTMVSSEQLLPPAQAPMSKPSMSGYGGGMYGDIKPEQVVFSDTAETNVQTEVQLNELDLVDQDLNSVPLTDIQGERNLLLVILRGAPLCPFCTAQTSRLKSNYEQFADLRTEVAVVFPGTVEDLEQLLDKAAKEGQTLPFPILVDTEFSTIRKLDIAGDKALPSTFIIDRNGNTQFAYVGANRGDRPSIKSLIATLERLQPESSSVEE